MIIVRLIGGLGNQMFQYAIGRSLAHTNKTVFKMDISDFKTYDLRRYELGDFNINENFASRREINKFKPKKGLPKLLRKLFPLSSTIVSYYKEKESFHYDSEVFNLKGSIYLIGYWQSEKYFKNIEDIIRRDFTFKNEPDKKNKEFLNKITNCNSVALHIRRGDYVTDPKTSEKYGTCGLEYYEKCVNIIAKKVNNPTFFVFSDDSEWAEENTSFNFPAFYISHNGPDKGCEDLRLMIQCKHFIIANSSFSWWGAWLSQNQNKIILAPKRWLKREDKIVKDLIPEGWIRV